jgi:arabinofuranosyltransferase
MLLYLAYIMLIGGDFMRGRFLMPLFVASSLLGVFALPELLKGRSLSRPLAGGLAFVLVGVLLAQTLLVPHNGYESPAGILNERAYYSTYHLRDYLKTGRLEGPDTKYVGDLRAFAEQCGPITVHAMSLGAASYFVGPDVTVIDLIGLTDRYIANLPKSSLIDHSRPGHPSRNVPISYLASRRDISLFQNWHDAVATGDCRIIAATATHESSKSTYRVDQPTDILPVYTRP